MPASKAQQKAVSKYMKENYDVYQIRMPKGRKSELQKYAAQREESLNGFINRAINEAIARDGSEKPADAPQSVPGIPIPQNEERAVSVSPEQMDQIKAHIVQTGESEAAFIERAAESTIKRDMVAFNMGINPAAGKEGQSNE